MNCTAIRKSNQMRYLRRDGKVGIGWWERAVGWTREGARVRNGSGTRVDGS